MVAVAVGYSARSKSTARARGWQELYAAMGQNDLDELRTVADNYSQSDIGMWALQVLGDSLFDLGIAGEGAARVHAQSFGGLDLGDAIVTNALIDDDTSGFLRQHLACTIIAVGCFPGHTIKREVPLLRAVLRSFLRSDPPAAERQRRMRR